MIDNGVCILYNPKLKIILFLLILRRDYHEEVGNVIAGGLRGSDFRLARVDCRSKNVFQM